MRTKEVRDRTLKLAFVRLLSPEQKKSINLALGAIQGYKPTEELVLSVARIGSLLEFWHIAHCKAKKETQREALNALWEIVDLGKLVYHVFRRIVAACEQALTGNRNAVLADSLLAMMQGVITLARECIPPTSYALVSRDFSGVTLQSEALAS